MFIPRNYLLGLVFALSIALVLPASLSSQATVQWEQAPPLPMRLANTAVAALQVDDTCLVYAFMGIDSSKSGNGVSARAFCFNTRTERWREISSVPGKGRLAAAAQPLHGRVYIFGGYIVNPDGSETSSAAVDIYDPVSDSFSHGADAPVAVDDQVCAVWRDSLVYNVSGWSNTRNVDNVQVYDPRRDSWRQATRIDGPGLFGHAGGIAGDVIVYLGGVRINGFNGSFEASNEAWAGRIDRDDPLSIAWERLPAQPGQGKYRAAALGIGKRVIVSGGTLNPYNFNGIGYNGDPAEPDPLTFAIDVTDLSYEALSPNPRPTMDHRGLARCGLNLYSVGGFEAGQRVTNRVAILRTDGFVTSIGRDAIPSQPALEIIAAGPLPAKAGFHLRYRCREAGPVYASVFDALQRRRLTITARALSKGKQSIRIDCRALPAGRYTVLLEQAGRRSALHFLLLP